jgi:hypothetical protein
MITVLFLSGEFIKFDAAFDGATVYNLKRSICDWMEEKDENVDVNIDLIHIYPYSFEEQDELDNNHPIVSGETYRSLIETIQRRIIFLKDNDKVYWKNENEDNEDENLLTSEDFPKLQETYNIQYYFDLLSFQRSWIRSYNFFTSQDYELPRRDNDSLYPSETEWEESEDEDNWDWEDKKCADHTLECIRFIFPKIQSINDIQYMRKIESEND